jgi:heat shock protein HslJ
MIRPSLALVTFVAFFGVSACQPVSADGVPPEYMAIEWKLASIDGEPVSGVAKIDFSEAGKFAGQGPCNRYFGSYSGILPDFRPGPVASTKMACPDMAAETAFFAALGAMSRAEVTGPVTLTLTGPDGRNMVFVRPLN